MMKDEFNRTDGLFSLCGLNCGLCPMQIRGECSGCFNGSTCYQTCPLAPCSMKHGHVQYCFQCPEYPCKRYDGIDRHDSLISHRNQKKDLMKARTLGIDAYLAEQREKVAILHSLLENYDDGGRDVFFCLAVNMLEVEELKGLLAKAAELPNDMLLKEKTRHVVELLHAVADKRGVPLELRPW